MDIQDQIDAYIAAQPPAKREEMEALHRRILAMAPGCQLWFLDGLNDQGKVVSNPSIGYGATTLDYANGDSRAFYRIGFSANTAGLSVYVIGMPDKTYLSRTYGDRLGKAKITGYCVKLRSLKDVRLDVLDEMIADGLGAET